MRKLLLKLQAQFQKYWQRLSGQQKIIVASLSLVILFSLIGITFYATRPEYSLLFSDLSPEDASAIVNKLKEAKINFQITDSGRSIRVPTKDVHEIRLSLASQGLPQGGGLGFEIFDKSLFGMTEFTQRLNFQRALQGELERTIRQISSVEQARVHLVLPEKELYSEKEKEPTASVILKLKPATKLTKSQIKAILNLVKTSVEGLKENNISIVDTNGMLLSRSSDEEEATFAPEVVSSHFELKKMVEKNIEDQVSSLLATILGPNKAVVRATVELDLVKKEATEETYSPVGKGESGIIRSQQKKSEYFKGTGSTAGIGVPGVTTNIGNVPGYQQAQTSGGTSDYTKDELITNYEINKKVAHLVSTPGEIKRLSIAVLLDGNLPAERIATIKQAISSGMGINLERGDQIVVEGVAFDKSYIEQEKKEMEKLAKKEMVAIGFKTASIVFVTLVIILFFLFTLRHYRVMKKAAEEIKKTQEMIPPTAIYPAVEEGAGELNIKQQIETLIKEKPQRVAEAIKNWMSGA